MQQQRGPPFSNRVGGRLSACMNLRQNEILHTPVLVTSLRNAIVSNASFAQHT